MESSFSFPRKKRKAKESARVPLDPARRQWGRRVSELARRSEGYGGLRQADTLNPPPSPMLGAGQRDISKPKDRTPFGSPPSRGLPEASRYAGGDPLCMSRNSIEIRRSNLLLLQRLTSNDLHRNSTFLLLDKYFKNLAEETGIPYQNLINLYLRDCVQTNRKLSLNWHQ